MIWLLGLVKNRYVQYGAIALAGLLLFRWYVNGVAEKEFQKGKLSGISETLKQHEEEWKKAQESIQKAQDDINLEKQSISEAKATLDASRAKIKTSLDSGLSQIKTELDKLPDKIAAIPAGDIPDEIRKRLEVLR